MLKCLLSGKRELSGNAIVLLCVLFLTLALSGAVEAQTPAHSTSRPLVPPSKHPILRVEAGMHTAEINCIGIDRAGHFLVTASSDKTARIWSLADGKLLRTLRPPIADKTEGRIYAAALSPDGATVACGGATGYTWDGTSSVYLFDRESGAMLRRLPCLAAEAIIDLSFSPDGKFLAVGLGATGVRIFALSDGHLVMTDKECRGRCNSVDWSGDGKLVAGCGDGFVRLYNGKPTFKLIAKTKAPGGQNVNAARFSPDGSRVAVTYNDTCSVSVLSGNTLTSLYTPNVAGIPLPDAQYGICWSSDGRMLYASGSAQDAGGILMRVWTDGGRGPFHDTNISHGTVCDLRTLPAGSGMGTLVYADTILGWGLADAQGNRRDGFGQTPPIADYRNSADSFSVNEDGSSIGFGYEPFGRFPACFNLPERTLSPISEQDAPPASPALFTPDTQATQVKIEISPANFFPYLNGRLLPVAGEIGRSVAIAPDRQRFLLGTSARVRCFGFDGKEKWNLLAPDAVWAVNVARNGSVGVAAFGDGTIRWFRMRDGVELLNFFPCADRKRWVLWTPDGYYDCSPGGEDLIGWHMNRGKDQAADFYPASRFRNVYYRPDVIQLILTTLDSNEAVRLADLAARRTPPSTVSEKAEAAIAGVAAVLPPVVSIVSPSDFTPVSGESVTNRFRVRAPVDAPVMTVRALVDGRSPNGARGMDFSAVAMSSAGAADDLSLREITVRIPDHDCEIAVLAENKNAVSVPATVRVKWQKPLLSDAPVFKPKLYVLAIGVGKYALPGHDLAFPAKDAADFAAAIGAQGGGLYREAETKILTDDQATKDNVLDGLEWVQRQTTARDVAMVFISGHGDNDPDGDYYFLTHDFDGERWKRTAVSYRDINATLKNIKGKALCFIDTCHAGDISGTTGIRRKGGDPDINGLINDLTSAENGVVVFAASTGRQSALEDSAWGNGAFTLALIEAITGKDRGTVAPTKDALAAMSFIHQTGKATITSLDAYLAERVKQLTGGKQTPTTTKPQTVPDFPIAAVP